jgi:hypothetical protein
MRQLSYKRLLTLVCLVLSMTVMWSCKKTDDAVNNGQVQLLSFGPTGARPGDTLRFIGQNLNQVTAIQFTGANAVVTQNAFKQQTSDLILLIVPPSVEKGYVTLKTPGGDIVTKTMLNLNVKTSASIASITKQARPGENVTLTGNYLNWVSRITFNKNKVVTTFVSQAQNQLVVKVPDDAQTGPLLVSFTGTDTVDVLTADTLKVALPTATAFLPNAVKHADNVTITGTDLDLAKKVYFNGVSTPITTFVSQSATQLVVKVPGATTKGKVILEAASGVQQASTVDLDVQLPTIASMTPNPVDPGTNVTITGTNLNLVSSVSFQNAAAVTTFVSQSATQLVVKVPAGVLKGKVTLGVLNSTVTVQSSADLDINGAVPPPVLTLPIYTDAVSTNWTSTGGWLGGGWGGTSDIGNTAVVREGTKSIKINYVGGYGSPFQIGGASISLAAYTLFKISIYGAPGSAGKTITIGINGVNGKYNINVVEGKWTDYAIPLSTLTSDATLKEIWIQEYSGTGGFSVYADAIGLF